MAAGSVVPVERCGGWRQVLPWPALEVVHSCGCSSGSHYRGSPGLCCRSNTAAQQLCELLAHMLLFAG